MPRVPAAAAVMVVVAFCTVFNTLRYPVVWETAGDLFGSTGRDSNSGPPAMEPDTRQAIEVNLPNTSTPAPALTKTDPATAVITPPTDAIAAPLKTNSRTDSESVEPPRTKSKSKQHEKRSGAEKPICIGDVCFLPGSEPKPKGKPPERESKKSWSAKAPREPVSEKKKPAEAKSAFPEPKASPPPKPQRPLIALRDMVPVVVASPSKAKSASPLPGDPIIGEGKAKASKPSSSAFAKASPRSAPPIQDPHQVRRLPPLADVSSADAEPGADLPQDTLPIYPVTPAK